MSQHFQFLDRGFVPYGYIVEGHGGTIRGSDEVSSGFCCRFHVWHDVCGITLNRIIPERPAERIVSPKQCISRMVVFVRMCK